MLTKADFQKAISDNIGNYQTLAPLYNAQDPRIIQHLDAIATMLAMLSAQIETSLTEPFAKTRDATVMADAAMRGIVPKATPAKAIIQVVNRSSVSATVDIGRRLFDSDGLLWVSITTATVLPGETGFFDAVQIDAIEYPHTVSGSEPFYFIALPSPDDGQYLSAISVKDSRGYFEPRERYVNILPGERVFHVESDDRKQVYVRFGMADIVGVQPKDGDELTVSISWSAGDNAKPESESPFAFEYILSPLDNAIKMTLSSVTLAGKPPISMGTLRELSKYPSVYDHNAVFMGEFDFIIRRAFPHLQFLSCWNETVEESVRGASVDNINRLFVACLNSNETVLTEASPEQPVAPEIVANLTDVQIAIKNTILAADDSYKIRFYTPVRSVINITINASVGTSFVISVVKNEIEEAILAEFGQASDGARKGRNKPLYQRIYALLKEKIPALSSGSADFKLSIEEDAGTLRRPEIWRYVSPSSLSVTVESVNMTPSAWGGG